MPVSVPAAELLLCVFSERPQDAESASMAWLTSDGYFSAVSKKYSSHDGQAKARALTGGLGGEERLKNLLDIAHGYSAAIVGEFYPDGTSGGFDTYFEFMFGFAVRRLYGVLDEQETDLLESGGACFDGRYVGGLIYNYLNIHSGGIIG